MPDFLTGGNSLVEKRAVMCVTNAPSGLCVSREMPFKIAFSFFERNNSLGENLDETIVH